MWVILKFIKIALAILFFICLFDLPYGFYQLVRFLAMVGFGILALSSYKANEEKFAITYVALLLLFQPIFKISLGRTLWNIVDIIVGVGLLVSIFISSKKSKMEKN